MTNPAMRVNEPAGTITIAPMRPEEHGTTIHSWLTAPKAWAWSMTEESNQGVVEYLRGVDRDPHQQAWVGSVDGLPTFLVETYDPREVLLTDVPEIRDGDIGMHVLVAPATGARVPGLTTSVMHAAARLCFEHLDAKRIVVEPDARNAAIAAKNAELGFRVLRELRVDGKLAHLSVLERERFARLAQDRALGAVAPAPHLDAAPMLVAHRRLIAKALAEFSHERLIVPEAVEGQNDRFAVRAGTVTYTFTAQRLQLEHWAVVDASIDRLVDGSVTVLDAQQLILDLHDVLGIPDALLSTYLEEVASTLASLSFRLRRSPSSEELAAASFQQIEGAMTDGHPCFVANSGRIGFGLEEFGRFAPEAAQPVRLEWLAARRSKSTLALTDGLDEASFTDQQCTPAERERFEARLRSLGADPAEYILLPVHPWQWEHRIAITFAPDLGRADLIHLGPGDDEYRAQQSIRTFANATDETRPYVKTALAVQNMGFLRGLSPAYLRVTPAINDWVASLVHGDATLAACGFEVLREFATVGYTGDAYHRSGIRSAQTKMLAALWRESAVPLLTDGERLLTMAALLHRDSRGAPLISALISASRVPAEAWVRAYLDAYVRPLVHCLLRYDLAFMPHGENLIVVLGADGVPSRVIMKDIGEEVAVLTDRVKLPEAVSRIRQPVEAWEQALAIFTDVFDGVLRHIASVLHLDGTLDEREFWRLVTEVVERHAGDHPELHGSVDLRAARFKHSCLNRLQLRNTLQMVDLADQSSSLVYAGTLANPIAKATQNA